MAAVDDRYSRPTEIIDSDHPEVVAFSRATVAGETDPRQMAVKLYYAVRDGILYDPYTPFFLPEHYRASAILEKRQPTRGTLEQCWQITHMFEKFAEGPGRMIELQQGPGSSAGVSASERVEAVA